MVALVATSTPASAEKNHLDVALAETLFRDAKALLEQDRYAEACPKLAESQRLDPAGGTILTLALCYEAEGKTASAYGAFFEAARFATRDGRADREKVAREHRAALEPTLSRLTLRVPPAVAALPGLAVTLDGAPVASAALGAATPVDPGKRDVRVIADGKRPWTATVDVGPRADAKVVDVGPLDDAPASAPAPTPAPRAAAPAREPSPLRLPVAISLVSAGGLALATGGYFALHARSLQDDARERCPASPCADEIGLARNDDAKSAARVATVATGVGLVAVGVGVYLLLTRDTKPSTSTSTAAARVTPFGAPAGGGAAFVFLSRRPDQSGVVFRDSVAPGNASASAVRAAAPPCGTHSSRSLGIFADASEPMTSGAPWIETNSRSSFGHDTPSNSVPSPATPGPNTSQTARLRSAATCGDARNSRTLGTCAADA